jgi:hypothetical protein
MMSSVYFETNFPEVTKIPTTSYIVAEYELTLLSKIEITHKKIKYMTIFLATLRPLLW